jgi:hypothetical protein
VSTLVCIVTTLLVLPIAIVLDIRDQLRRRPPQNVEADWRPPTAVETWDRFLALRAEWESDHPEEPVPSLVRETRSVLDLRDDR